MFCSSRANSSLNKASSDRCQWKSVQFFIRNSTKYKCKANVDEKTIIQTNYLTKKLLEMKNEGYNLMNDCIVLHGLALLVFLKRIIARGSVKYE